MTNGSNSFGPFEKLPDIVIVSGADGNLRYANEAARRFFGEQAKIRRIITSLWN